MTEPGDRFGDQPADFDSDEARAAIERGRAEIERILDQARNDQGSYERVTTSPGLGGEPASGDEVRRRRRRWWKWPRRRPTRPTTLDEVVLADHHLDVQLKAVVARGALLAMGVQLFVADTVFVLYAWLGTDWTVPGPVILGWLSATVVEVIGVVAIVARYLFPKDGHQWSRPPGQQYTPPTNESEPDS
ncbi:hypothetical protein [Curtobacterium aetherium]|uniref:Uncharacterized protein n=1 Tax=Curtobacterium aetherium TaxID=2841594 RepID=A0ACD1E139_9MICO|nr:hypothetical protein [Curtobacterium sp. L6-1]QWS32600.1 hypothetical protein KM842_09885 [Curtobacterium sp. L6-1]